MTSISRTGAEDSSAYPSSTKKAENAEKEATKRIEVAENHARQFEAEQEQALSSIRDQYQKQFVSEEAHQEALLENQRMKGYSNLRDLQRGQTEEISRIRQEGDTRINDLRNYYRDTKYATELHGTQDLKDLELNNQQIMDYTRKAGTDNLTGITEEYLKNTEDLAAQYENKELQIKGEQQKELDRKRLMGYTAKELAEGKFQEQFEQMNTTHQEQLKHLEGNANRQIQKIRQDTADKLSTYKTRQTDPFYKMMDLDTQLKESEDGFTLTLKVPEYEQKNLRAAVKGENIVVMGQRRNEETLDLGNGTTQGTASYQSYHESIPLSWPVDPGRLTKEFKGDTVTIRIPKKNKFASHEPPHVTPKSANETAQFPRTIQDFFTEKQVAAGSQNKLTRGTPGSGPLT